MPGPKPQPAELKERKGNPGRKPIVRAPAELGLFSATPPKSLKGRPAKAIWRRLSETLRPLKFVKASDETALERYCSDLAAWYEVTAELDKSGRTYRTESAHGTMLRIHPLFTVQDRLAKRLEGFEDRFGLNPAARQRIMQGLAAQAGGGLFGEATSVPEQPSAPAGSPIGILSEASPVGGRA